jgi:hypothetical protein
LSGKIAVPHLFIAFLAAFWYFRQRSGAMGNAKKPEAGGTKRKITAYDHKADSGNGHGQFQGSLAISRTSLPL